MQVVNSIWDIRVVSAMNAASVITYVPRWTSIEFSDTLNDFGSGKMVHDFKDPFFSDFEVQTGLSLLTGPYALQILRNSTPVFTFFIEDVQLERLPDGETVTLSGKGIGSALDWAVVLPEGFTGSTRVGATTSTRPKFFDRLFPGYVEVVRCATTTNISGAYSSGQFTGFPGVGAKLVSTSNQSINSVGIDGITDLVVGDTILLKNQTNAAQNGIYWVSVVGSSSTAWQLQRTATSDGSPATDFTVGNNVFVQEGATNGYKAFYLSSNSGLTLSSQVGTYNLSYTQQTTGTFTGLSAFYILFKEAATGYEYSSAEATFGNVITESGRGGPDFAVSWPIYLDSVINANLGKLDSKGQTVQDGGTFSVPAGKKLSEVLKQVTDQTGLSWHFDATGSVSFAVAPFSRNGVVNSVPFGVDRTSGSTALLFTLPSLQESETKTSSTDRRTVAYGSDGRGVDRLISTNQSVYGVRESYFENTSSDAPAVANITGSAMRRIDGGRLSQTAKFPERTGQVAWSDFFVGDKILLETQPGLYSSQIISAIAASITGANEQTIEVTFGEVFPDIATDLTTQSGFGSLNAPIIASFSGTPPNVNLPAPELTTATTAVVGLSNRVTVSWDNTNSGRVSQYEVDVFREGTEKVAASMTRSGNIAAITFSSAHGLSNGKFINIYSDEGFSGFNIPVLSSSSSVIYYANQGPDETATGPTTVKEVLEYSTVIVDGAVNTATIENLSSPSSTYSYCVTPCNEYGIRGETSALSTFASSNEPYQLVGSAVQSSTYSPGSSGWRISADGTAEFNGGAFSVTSIDIGGADNTSFHVNTEGDMWLGASASVSAPFRVSKTGAMTATSGTFSGAITGSTIDIGTGATSFHVDINGNMWSGAAAFANGAFRVSNTGALDIGGLDTTSFHVDASGNMWVGGSTYASAPFKISAAGFVTSTNGATFSGSIVSNGDARFDGGGGNYSYIQNDGRFQSISGGTVYAQMGQNGVLTNSLNGATQNYINMLGNYVGFRYNIGFGPCDDTYYAAFYATGNTADGNGFSATATRISDNFQYSWSYLQGVSDRRVKINIEEVSEDFEDKFLNQLKIYQFDKINFADDNDLHAYGKHLGVMADEIKEIFPQWESSRSLKDPDGADADKIRTVDYQSMIPGLIWLMQRLNTRIKELEARLGI